MYDRRSFLINSAGFAGLALAPRMAFAKAETDRRFVFIIQRGAADGLARSARSAIRLSRARADSSRRISSARRSSTACSRCTRR